MKILNELGFKDIELELIEQCLIAASDGPFFPDWEFQTLIGLERADIQTILACWPKIDLSETGTLSGIQSTMVNLLGYPHGQDRVWGNYIAGSKEDVKSVLEKWATLTRNLNTIT